jgi:hypothetical protein
LRRAPKTLPLLSALALLVCLEATPAAADGPRGEDPPAPAGRGPEAVTLRFDWPAALDAQVSYRHTRRRTGAPATVFTARWHQRAEREPSGWRISTAGTRWEGEAPFPAEVAGEALRASERLVQRIAPGGQFRELENAEALRPVLARVYEEAGVPEAQAQRAVALAEAGARAEAEELWNLGVGFWIDAELELGEPYVMPGEAELPLLPGVRAGQSIEFQVRRRVPCGAGDRGPRCVEVLLRATPDRDALRRSARAIEARLVGAGAGARHAPQRLPEHAERPEIEEAAAVEPALPEELTAESELVLVTDPATLLPRRMVWTRSVRLGGADRDAPGLEQVDRREYDYRYPEPAPATATKRKPPRRAARR